MLSCWCNGNRGSASLHSLHDNAGRCTKNWMRNSVCHSPDKDTKSQVPVRRKLKAKRRPKSDLKDQWFAAFVLYIKNECHLAQNTVDAYRRDLIRFATWLDNRRVEALDVQDLADYAGWLAEQELAPASISRTRRFDSSEARHPVA